MTTDSLKCCSAAIKAAMAEVLPLPGIALEEARALYEQRLPAEAKGSWKWQQPRSAAASQLPRCLGADRHPGEGWVDVGMPPLLQEVRCETTPADQVDYEWKKMAECRVRN